MMKELAMATLVAGGVCAAARKAKKEAMNAQRIKDFKSGTRNLSSVLQEVSEIAFIPSDYISHAKSAKYAK